MKVEKYVREDGKVAVLYSPGYGAGWSTWCSDSETREQILFDKNIVEMILQTNFDCPNSTEQMEQKVTEYINSSFGEFAVYCGGVRDLDIAWMEPGTKFIVREHDGNEFLEREDQFVWDVA